jgi:cell division protein FtsW
MFVMVLFGLMIWRGVVIARKARDQFGFLLAIGITCSLAFQAMINIAVITAVIPFTGMALPFLSYGGSSLVTTLISIGILLSVSRDAVLTRNVQQRRPGRKPASESVVENFDMWRRDGRPRLSRPRRRR